MDSKNTGAETMSAKTGANRNGFRKGETTFKCNCCGRLTRHTGVQSVGSQVCPECYELAGIYNAYLDGADMARYADSIRALTETVVERGGKLDNDARELMALSSSSDKGANQ